MNLFLGSNNSAKINEIKPILSHFNLTTALDYINAPNPDETGNTLTKNALIKANQFSIFSNQLTLSDDSGLFIQALNGEPGVITARYASDHNEELNVKKVLHNLKGISNRNAVFRTVIAVMKPYQKPYLYRDELHGHILNDNQIKGYTYKDIFYIPSLNKTIAELTDIERMEYSHRCKAIKHWLKTLK